MKKLMILTASLLIISSLTVRSADVGPPVSKEEKFTNPCLDPPTFIDQMIDQPFIIVEAKVYDADVTIKAVVKNEMISDRPAEQATKFTHFNEAAVHRWCIKEVPIFKKFDKLVKPIKKE